MSLCCQQDDRRDAVRRMNGLNGLDYVEVRDDQVTLNVFFLGKLPKEFIPTEQYKPSSRALAQYLRVEGGRRTTGIQVIGVTPVPDPDTEKDDFLEVKLDRPGDFSTYRLRLVGVKKIDPRYGGVNFSFKINCPSDLDCAPVCACAPPVLPEPEINYLARDYQSFRQLILDRLAVVMPEWKETHVPDIGIMLVELLAYTGDYLSYYQDAVANEAYLDTARQRISIRRHARLVDYRLHEGCNARTWMSLEISGGDSTLDPAEVSFITGMNGALPEQPLIFHWQDLAAISGDTYEVFEPLVADRSARIQLRAAHSCIRIYTWGEKQCCLEQGSTRATLVDEWRPATSDAARRPSQGDGGRTRALHLSPGDVLIFEEVIGPKTGLEADADRTRRHAVRLTRVTPLKDTLFPGHDGLPVPLVEVEWTGEDKLPFTFCISAIGPAPECRYIEDISVARGNVLLVDHGRTVPPEELGAVPSSGTKAECECAGEPSEIAIVPARFSPRLSSTPLTFGQTLPSDDPAHGKWASAASFLKQDVRLTTPEVSLTSQPAAPWQPVYDLIESRPDDCHFAVEIDNDGLAHLRFGDGELGIRPAAGMDFQAGYRVGNGSAGNVGAESISRMVLGHTRLSGVSLKVRNPLPAQGGTGSEPMAEARLFAPHLFRKRIERAITAGDYEEIAERNEKIQRASAALDWTGSWYEADVAVDPLGTETADPGLLREIDFYLEQYRRMGHDLNVMPARYVPLDLRLEVCALPGFERAHVKAALLDVFSTRVLPGGKRGFFHPDNLTFGEGIFLSRIVATAQAVPGVECAQVTRLQRLFQAPNHEIENGVLPLATAEIAQLDNDPDFPECGRLEIVVKGGR